MYRAIRIALFFALAYCIIYAALNNAEIKSSFYSVQFRTLTQCAACWHQPTACIERNATGGTGQDVSDSGQRQTTGGAPEVRALSSNAGDDCR